MVVPHRLCVFFFTKDFEDQLALQDPGFVGGPAGVGPAVALTDTPHRQHAASALQRTEHVLV